MTSKQKQQLKAARHAFSAFKRALKPVLKASDIDQDPPNWADKFLNEVEAWIDDCGINQSYGPN
jgi:hypothetical protein